MEHVEADRLRIPIFNQQHGALHKGNCGAIIWRDVIDVVGRCETAGTRHVLYDDDWIAWDVLAKMPCDKARLGVVPAARTGANYEGNLLAGIEI